MAASASSATNLEELQKSLELIYNPDLSACSFEWAGLDESSSSSLNNSSSCCSTTVAAKTTVAALATTIALNGAKAKRYGVVLNGIDLDAAADEDEHQSHQEPPQSQTSTPIKKGLPLLTKSQSRCHIDRTFNGGSPALKEKSATLPQNMTPPTAHTFPPKTSFLLKSSPRILFNYSSDAAIATSSPSPKKSLSFIRRAHSTKLSRSNSLLKSLTTKCGAGDLSGGAADALSQIVVDELQFERLERYFRSDNCSDMVREWFFPEKIGTSSAAVDAAEVAGSRLEGEGGGGVDDEIHSGKSLELNFFLNIIYGIEGLHFAVVIHSFIVCVHHTNVYNVGTRDVQLNAFQIISNIHTFLYNHLILVYS